MPIIRRSTAFTKLLSQKISKCNPSPRFHSPHRFGTGTASSLPRGGFTKFGWISAIRFFPTQERAAIPLQVRQLCTPITPTRQQIPLLKRLALYRRFESSSGLRVFRSLVFTKKAPRQSSNSWMCDFRRYAATGHHRSNIVCDSTPTERFYLKAGLNSRQVLFGVRELCSRSCGFKIPANRSLQANLNPQKRRQIRTPKGFAYFFTG